MRFLGAALQDLAGKSAFEDLTSGGGSLNPLPTTEPATPAADSLSIWSRLMAGRPMIGWIDDDGEKHTVGPHLARNRIVRMVPNAAVTVITYDGQGTALASTAAAIAGTARVPATTNLFTMARRIGYVTGATAGLGQGARSPGAEFFRGNAANLGGFHFIARFGISHAAAVAQARAFVGMAPAAAIGNVNPSTLTNAVGAYFDSGETNWKIMTNDATASPVQIVDLGANYPSNTLSVDWYELQLYCKPNDTKIEYRMERLNVPGQAVAVGSLTTDLPTNTQLLAPIIMINNGTTALAAAIDFGGWYVESDN